MYWICTLPFSAIWKKTLTSQHPLYLNLLIKLSCLSAMYLSECVLEILLKGITEKAVAVVMAFERKRQIQT